MKIDAIQKLIEADEKTRENIQKQYAKRFEIKQAVEEEKKHLSDEAWEAANKQVAETKVELDEKIRQDEKDSLVYYEKASEQIQKYYDDHKTVWKEELYKRIVTPESEAS